MNEYLYHVDCCVFLPHIQSTNHIIFLQTIPVTSKLSPIRRSSSKPCFTMRSSTVLINAVLIALATASPRPNLVAAPLEPGTLVARASGLSPQLTQAVADNGITSGCYTSTTAPVPPATLRKRQQELAQASCPAPQEGDDICVPGFTPLCCQPELFPDVISGPVGLIESDCSPSMLLQIWGHMCNWHGCTVYLLSQCASSLIQCCLNYIMNPLALVNPDEYVGSPSFNSIMLAGTQDVDANNTETMIRKDGGCTVTTPRTFLAKSLDLATRNLEVASLTSAGDVEGMTWDRSVESRLRSIFCFSQTVISATLYHWPRGKMLRGWLATGICQNLFQKHYLSFLDCIISHIISIPRKFASVFQTIWDPPLSVPPHGVPWWPVIPLALDTVNFSFHRYRFVHPRKATTYEKIFSRRRIIKRFCKDLVSHRLPAWGVNLG